MSGVDLTAAVDAAARGFCADLTPPVTLDDLSAIQRHVIREQALSYVTHATPLIEAAVREQVARDIEADAESVEKAAEGWRQSERHPVNSLAAARYDRTNAEAREAAAKHLRALAARIARSTS